MDFETEVRTRLQNIEDKLNKTCANNELIQELIRTKLRDTPCVSSTETQERQRPLYFVVTTYIVSDGTPETFQVTGRTYDVRDRLKMFGQVSFVKETKGWEYVYDQTIYEQVVEFLGTLTTDIKYNTVVKSD